MARRRLRLELKLPPGRWRLTWFGALTRLDTTPNEWGIHTFFSQLHADQAAGIDTVEHCVIALPHMLTLPIGTIVESLGDKVKKLDAVASNMKRGPIRLNLEPDSIRIVSRATMKSPRRPHLWHSQPEYDALLVCVPATTDTPATLIPCATLFQYYWGVSAKLAKAVMFGQLEDIERNFFKLVSSHPATGRVELRLRKKWSDDLAPYLAMMLTDEAALSAGRDIYRILIDEILAFNPTTVLKLTVRPPFTKLIYFEADYVVWQQDSGEPTCLVTNVISSRLNPHLRIVDFGRENDGRKARDSTEIDDLNLQDPPWQGEEHQGLIPTSDIELSESPSGYGDASAELDLLSSTLERFPDLQQLEVHKVPADTEPSDRRRTRAIVSSGPWSAITGSALRDSHQIRADIVGRRFRSGDQWQVLEDTTEVSLENKIELDLEGFAEALLISQVAPNNDPPAVDVSFVDPYETIPPQSMPSYYHLPRSVGGRKIAWLYRDADCNVPKRGICAEFTFIDQHGSKVTRYVLDWEHRIAKARAVGTVPTRKQTQFVVAWHRTPMEWAETASALRELIDAIAKNRSSALHVRPHPEIAMETLRHTSTPPVRLRARILEARDRFGAMD